MLGTMTRIKDTATAILKFEEAATKHADATEQGDYNVSDTVRSHNLL
jgi:hypothetical protein